MQVAEKVAIGIIAGAVFGLYGYFTKSERGEGFNYRKILRTMVVYGAAGAIVGGDPTSTLSESSVEAATAQTVVLGQVFDMAWARVQRYRRGIEHDISSLEGE